MAGALSCICAAFSARLMRPTRSLTRFLIGTEGSRKICALAPAGSIAATTKRHPATLTAILLRCQPTRRGGTVKPQEFLLEAVGELHRANEFLMPCDCVAVGHPRDEIADGAQLSEPIPRVLPWLGQQGRI